MALRKIVLDGDPILKKKCRPVTDFNERLSILLDDMAETMISANGLGLAGPQVGVLRRVFVVVEEYTDDNGEKQHRIIDFVNPEILSQEGEATIFEGCLSFPERNGMITRPRKVKARAQDRFGNCFEIEAKDMLARAICHEYDHLEGITVLDRATVFYEDLTEEELRELELDGYDE